MIHAKSRLGIVLIVVENKMLNLKGESYIIL